MNNIISDNEYSHVLTKQKTDSNQSHYTHIRARTERLCETLETEDYCIQTATEISPLKWHLAHTSWFYETLLLKPFLQHYHEFDHRYASLFNSYYDTLGTHHPRTERGLLSRPTVGEIYRYRAYIDRHMTALIANSRHPDKVEIQKRITLGLNHEQQHQELMLTDIKHIFAYNPLRPVYLDSLTNKNPSQIASTPTPLSWIDFRGGIKEIGAKKDNRNSFAYDNEYPRHKEYLNDYRLASRLTTNQEFIEFIAANGYKRSELWLSDAWKLIQKENWQAPLYWQKQNNQWHTMTLSGMRVVEAAAPVCHVSFFEAAAFARWKKKRLPTEAEWENAAKGLPIEGNFFEQGLLHPQSVSPATNAYQPLTQIYGDVWEWTQSPYSPYPGYHQARGPMGEYNGKFMNGQMTLRGGSCVTPIQHIRTSYRNFFYPWERWQFSGIRLAEDNS